MSIISNLRRVLIQNGAAIEIKHDDAFRRGHDGYTAGSVIGSAIRYNDDIIEAVKRALDLGHEQHFFTHDSTVLVANRAEAERRADAFNARPSIAAGQWVIFEGRVLEVVNRPNNNLGLIPVPDVTVKARIDSILEAIHNPPKTGLHLDPETGATVYAPPAKPEVPGASPGKTDFNKRLDKYVEGVERLRNEWLNGGTAKTKRKAFVSIERGQKYARIVVADQYGDEPPTRRSVHTFVDLTNGNVLKAAGWKKPETKNPRSNINDADFGLSGVTWLGAVYLK